MKLAHSLARLFLAIAVCTVCARADGPVPATRTATFEVQVQRDVMIPARDGTLLAADIYRPAHQETPADGRFPCLLTRTPYNKGDGTSPEARYFAERGYVVVVNDVRGRYKSQGTWRLIADDPADGFDVVEWIAQQPWSDGKVGTFGSSYAGGTQYALAAMNPPHLTTMIPADALSNCGRFGMRHNGAFELRFANWIFQIGAPNGHAALAQPTLREALVASGLRIREHLDSMPIFLGNTPLRAAPEYENWLVEALRSGPEAPMWHVKGMSVIDHVNDCSDVPILHVTGWYDSWTRQNTLNYEALSATKQAPQHLIIGPWTHGGQSSNVAGEVEFGSDAALDFNGVRLAWFDRWMSQPGSSTPMPPVWIYVMGAGDDRRNPNGRLNHGGHWRVEREWPIQRTVSVPYYLSGEGTLTPEIPTNSSNATTFTFDPNHPVPTIGGNISSNQGLMTNGGYDQRPRDDTHAATNRLPLSERPDVLVFRTAPLVEDLEITGLVKIDLWVASTAADTDFTAKLVEEIPPSPDYPLGYDLNIGDSILRMRYRHGFDAPAPPMEPAQVYRATFELYPTANVFKRGHRLRIDISSSNYPRFDVNPNTYEPLGSGRRRVKADNTVWHDHTHPSHVVLPVIPRTP
jgi:putative CocE/NonD family hydrolase